MGMRLSIGEITDRTRHRLLDDPPLVWQLAAPDDPAAYAEARARAPKPTFGARLFRRAAAAAAPLVLEVGEGLDVDVDKAWHGLHYLFTGTVDGGNPPANFLMCGGQDVGTEDVGYGPARVISPDDTRSISQYLSSAGDHELLGRFDAARMTALEIYPSIWDEGEFAVEYLAENLAQVRRVVTSAEAKGRGLLLVLS